LIAELAPGTEPEYTAPRPEETRNSVADISAIRAALGFEPAFPTIDFSEVIDYRRRS